jgi:predicted MFS family arabinose efflux permease
LTEAGTQRWRLALFAIWLAWVSNFMVRSALAPGMVGIRADFRLSHGEGGLLATGFGVGYCAMMLPGGLLGDWLGRRPMVIFASLGWTALSLLIGLAPSYPALLLLMVMLGLTMGCFNGNDRAIVSSVTPREKMALGQGLSYTGLGIGNGLGVILAGTMAAVWGWRSSFLVFAGVSLLALVAIWRFAPEPRRGPSVPFGLLARQVFGNRDLWLLYVGGMPSVAAAWLLLTWSPTILLENTGLNLAVASLLVSGVGFVAVPALAGIGAVSDAFFRNGLGRKVVIAAGHLLLTLTLVLLALSLERRWGASAIATLLMAVSFGQWSPWAAAYALVADIVTAPAMGMAFGLGATMWSMGAIAAPWLAGLVRDATGSFTAVFYVLAGLSLAGAVLSAAVRPAFRLGPEPLLAR